MQRAYANIPHEGGEWQIHYHSAGGGTPLILMHPSPLSGAALETQVELLSPLAHCIAWDTPGYGASDALPASYDGDATLMPYVAALEAFLDTLGVHKAHIYGSATGAQIAIEFAKAYPERCLGLLLENVGSFSERDVESITEGYFPDFSPRIDGSHVTQMWDMARRTTRYFPWQSPEPDAERRTDYAPAAVVNGIFRDTLLAGPDYGRAYAAAFANERLEQLLGVSVATRIIHWQDSILGSYGERIAEAAMPPNIQILRAGPGMASRLDALRQAATELLAIRTGDTS